MSATIFFLLLILIIILYFTSKKVFKFLLSKKIDKICKQYVSKTLDYKPYTTFHSNLILLNNYFDKSFIIEKTGNTKINVSYMPNNILNFSEDVREITTTWSHFFKKIKKINLYYAQKEAPDILKKELYIPEKVDKIGKVENIVLWIGGGNQYTPLHFDHDDGFLCMITGSKRVRLIHPSLTKELSAYTTMMYSKYQSIDDFKKNYFDKYEKHPDIMEFHLRDGDCLFIPAGWWHDVKSGEDFNIAYTIWTYPREFGKKYNYEYTVKRIELIQERKIPKFFRPQGMDNDELKKLWKSGILTSEIWDKNMWITNPVYTDVYD